MHGEYSVGCNLDNQWILLLKLYYVHGWDFQHKLHQKFVKGHHDTYFYYMSRQSNGLSCYTYGQKGLTQCKYLAQ